MKAAYVWMIAVAAVALGVDPAMAQQAAASTSLNLVPIGAGFGAAITMIGGAYGISLIASRAVESMARQPEVAGQISGAMIVSSALIEGLGLVSLVVCMLVVFLV